MDMSLGRNDRSIDQDWELLAICNSNAGLANLWCRNLATCDREQIRSSIFAVDTVEIFNIEGQVNFTSLVAVVDEIRLSTVSGSLLQREFTYSDKKLVITLDMEAAIVFPVDRCEKNSLIAIIFTLANESSRLRLGIWNLCWIPGVSITRKDSHVSLFGDINTENMMYIHLLIRPSARSILECETSLSSEDSALGA